MEIQLNHVTKRFGPTVVLDDINLTLHSGRVYGLQGINGSGKTMLMRMTGGLIYPTSGDVLINGISLGGANSFPDSMGLLLENPSFPGKSLFSRWIHGLSKPGTVGLHQRKD